MVSILTLLPRLCVLLSFYTHCIVLVFIVYLF